MGSGIQRLGGGGADTYRNIRHMGRHADSKVMSYAYFYSFKIRKAG
jgi:hypothetical protein